MGGMFLADQDREGCVQAEQKPACGFFFLERNRETQTPLLMQKHAFQITSVVPRREHTRK